MGRNNNSDDMWELDKSQINIQESGENVAQNNKGFYISADDFGPLAKYVKDQNITDIDFNGTDLWLTDINNRHWKDANSVTPKFIRKLAQDIANSASKEFNQKTPCLEAETEDLRISILHNSIAQTGTTMCIRKTPRKNRITEKYALESTLADFRTQSLIANCVKAHMNFVICGEPRAGKTEFAKFISSFIPINERVITIEDVMEWRFKALHPDADVIEMKVNKEFDYSDGIIASLKQNPRWLMIAETRGKEVKNLIQSFSTGVNGITTLHTDDIRKIPSRIVNMADDSLTSARIENNAYEFIDVGVFISMFPDGNDGFVRRVTQLGFFSLDNDVKRCHLLIEGGELYKATIPESIKLKFEKAGVDDIFYNQEVYDRLRQQGYDVSQIVKDENLSRRYMQKHTISDIVNEDEEKAKIIRQRNEEAEKNQFEYDDNNLDYSINKDNGSSENNFVNYIEENNYNDDEITFERYDDQQYYNAVSEDNSESYNEDEIKDSDIRYTRYQDAPETLNNTNNYEEQNQEEKKDEDNYFSEYDDVPDSSYDNQDIYEQSNDTSSFFNDTDDEEDDDWFK